MKSWIFHIYVTGKPQGHHNREHPENHPIYLGFSKQKKHLDICHVWTVISSFMDDLAIETCRCPGCATLFLTALGVSSFVYLVLTEWNIGGVPRVRVLQKPGRRIQVFTSRQWVFSSPSELGMLFSSQNSPSVKPYSAMISLYCGWLRNPASKKKDGWNPTNNRMFSSYPLVNLPKNYRTSPCLMGKSTTNGHFQ